MKGAHNLPSVLSYHWCEYVATASIGKCCSFRPSEHPLFMTSESVSFFRRLQVKIATHLVGSSQEAPHDSKLGQEVIEYD